jgi:chitosanase
MMSDPIEALCRKITNIFEVDDQNGDYAYVEDLDDGRGYTVTHYGFVERTGDQDGVGDLEEVIRVAQMEDVLRLKADRESFPSNWKRSITEGEWRSKLIEACNSVAKQLYWQPAAKTVAEDNLTDNPFAYALYYDTIIQHGAGDDPDSFQSIRKKASGNLSTFLQVRRQVLLHPANPATRKVWAESVDRIEELERLLDHNQKLRGDLLICGHKLEGLTF